jgi:hypothetical protein
MFLLVARIFSIILAGVVVSKCYVDFKSRRESLQIFIFWIVTWAAIVLVAVRPSIVDTIILTYGSGETGLGTVFGMGLVFLFFIVYRLYVKLDRIEQVLTKTIQDAALREDWKSRK